MPNRSEGLYIRSWKTLDGAWNTLDDVQKTLDDVQKTLDDECEKAFLFYSGACAVAEFGHGSFSCVVVGRSKAAKQARRCINVY